MQLYAVLCFDVNEANGMETRMNTDLGGFARIFIFHPRTAFPSFFWF